MEREQVKVYQVRERLNLRQRTELLSAQVLIIVSSLSQSLPNCKLLNHKDQTEESGCSFK